MDLIGMFGLYSRSVTDSGAGWSGVRHDLEGLALSSSKDSETAAVQCDDLIDPDLIAEQHQRGIGEIHWRIRVLFDKAHRREELLRLSRFENMNAASLYKFRKTSWPSRVIFEQIHCLSDDSACCAKVASEIAKERRDCMVLAI